MSAVERADAIIRANYKYNPGAFYGSAAGLALGVGLVFDGIRFPAFDESTRLFDTVEGLVYVMTHECDVDQNNNRQFNDKVLVCPILGLEAALDAYTDAGQENSFMGLLPSIANDTVFRVLYLPRHTHPALSAGGLINLNQITSTSISEFSSQEAERVCALSSYGQRIVDFKLQNHLLRPKAEALPNLTG